MLVKDRKEKKLPERSIDMIILLTDGMPNSGEQAECVQDILCECTFDRCTLHLPFFFFHIVSVPLKESPESR